MGWLWDSDEEEKEERKQQWAQQHDEIKGTFKQLGKDVFKDLAHGLTGSGEYANTESYCAWCHKKGATVPREKTWGGTEYLCTKCAEQA